MYSPDDIHYAFETTRVLLEPDRRIDTFGTTRFDFLLVSELMDSVNKVRVREGSIEADRPQILRPQSASDFEFEGFGEKAEVFADWLRHNAANFAFLKYGFNFKRSNVSENLVHESFANVSDRIVEEIRGKGDPGKAVIAGVDDAWEICLLRFTLEMVGKSHDINTFDFKRRGLL